MDNVMMTAYQWAHFLFTAFLLKRLMDLISGKTNELKYNNWDHSLALSLASIGVLSIISSLHWAIYLLHRDFNYFPDTPYYLRLEFYLSFVLFSGLVHQLLWFKRLRVNYFLRLSFLVFGIFDFYFQILRLLYSVRLGNLLAPLVLYVGIFAFFYFRLKYNEK